jgi:hypothetical protein
VRIYLRQLQDQLEDTRDDMEYTRLKRMAALDEAALSRIDERLVGYERTLLSLVARENAVAQTAQSIAAVQQLTFELLFLHQQERGIKQAFRNLNSFFTALMEGRVKEGEEQFANFIVERVRQFSSIPSTLRDVLAFYVSLSYGDQQLRRGVPHEVAYMCSDPEIQKQAAQQKSLSDQKRRQLGAEIVTEGKRLDYPYVNDCGTLVALRYRDEILKTGIMNERNEYDFRWSVDNETKYKLLYYADESRRGQARYFNSCDYEIVRKFRSRTPIYPDDISPQLWLPEQIDALKKACVLFLEGKFSNIQTVFRVLEDFVLFCRLLCIPENHVRTQSGQYTERELPARSILDMRNEMEQELKNLPRYQAWVKVIQNREGEEITLTSRIVTREFIGAESRYGYDEILGYIKGSNAKDELIRHRSDIEAEILKRQEQWHKIASTRGTRSRRREPPQGGEPMDDAPPSHT